MRRSLFASLMGGSVVVALFAWACGSTETSTPAPVDSGSETSTPIDSGNGQGQTDAAADTGVDAGCDLDADLLDQIPDAEIPDTGTTTGICVACARDNCDTEIDKCNGDCQCKAVAEKGLVCYAKSGGDFAKTLTCIGNVPTAQLQKAVPVVNCINTKCKTECGADKFDAGDGGN